MMAIVNFNHDIVKKKLDIGYGDLVYLRGDVGLRAGVGVVVSTKRQSFDIYDTPLIQKGCFFIDNFKMATPVDGVLVYWFNIEKEMWMEDYDLSVA
jgi:hypothetical protein